MVETRGGGSSSQRTKKTTRVDRERRNIGYRSDGQIITWDTLYEKYSSSQDYYYSRDIGDILNNGLTPAVICWSDLICILNEEELLKMMYRQKEYHEKIALLTEYYKFHKDIPRNFCLPTCKIMNRYHDKKRRIEYNRIMQLLMDEAKSKNKKVAMNNNDNEIRLTDNGDDTAMIMGLSSSSEDKQYQLVGNLPHKNVLPGELLISLMKEKQKKIDPLTMNRSSNTLRDLNSRLGEITKSSFIDCKN